MSLYSEEATEGRRGEKRIPEALAGLLWWRSEERERERKRNPFSHSPFSQALGFGRAAAVVVDLRGENVRVFLGHIYAEHEAVPILKFLLFYFWYNLLGFWIGPTPIFSSPHNIFWNKLTIYLSTKSPKKYNDLDCQFQIFI